MIRGNLCSRLSALLCRNHRQFSTTLGRHEEHCCRFLVVGGGSAGCSMAAKLTNKFGKDNVIVIEPSSSHYYQPLFTLVGGGIKKLAHAVRPTSKVLPKGATWLLDEVESFCPDENFVCTKSGDQVVYEYMIVAMGLECHFNKIPGLVEGLNSSRSGVCSIYSPLYVENTFKAFNDFESGNAIFTHPATQVKCAGAPQKIMYLFEHHLRKQCRRDGAQVIFNIAMPVLFAAKHYENALWKVIVKRDIFVNLSRNLTSIDVENKVASFQDKCNPNKTSECEFSLLHVTPPQGPPNALVKAKYGLVDSYGYLNLCKTTLQHKKYENIYGLGDCTNLPTSKTAAAAAAQSIVVLHQIASAISGKAKKVPEYNGYTGCPLLTSYGTCIMAEFDYDKNPLETLPFRQDRELALTYHLYLNLMPYIYWNKMLKGNWDGPQTLRKVFRLGMG